MVYIYSCQGSNEQWFCYSNIWTECMNNCVKFHDYEYNPVIIKVATTKKPVVGIYSFTDTSQNTIGPIGALLS